MTLWKTEFNNVTGIYISNITLSDGTELNYGKIPESVPENSVNMKYEYTFDNIGSYLAGLSGYSQT